MLKTEIKTVDVLIGALIAAIFIFFSFCAFGLFESLEKFLYGVEMRLSLPPSTGPNRIAIVNIDQKSIRHLGPWPWPRSIIADMVRILKNNGAKLIGLDLKFSEREQNQGLREIRGLHNEVINKLGSNEVAPWLIDKLNKIEEKLDSDKILVLAVKDSNNVILPVFGTPGKYETELVFHSDSILSKNSMQLKGERQNLEDFVAVRDLAIPFDDLAKNSHGLGHINLSPEGTIKGQTHLLFFDYRGHIIPSMPFRLALEYLGERHDVLTFQKNSVHLAKSIVPVTNGEILVRFKGGKHSFPYYSFVDILSVKNVPAVFKDKIVLIGNTAEDTRYLNTPVDQKMPGVEYIANVLENLIDGRYLKRPGSMLLVESVILILIILFSSHALPRLSPLNRFGLVILFILLVILTAVISFIAWDIWFKTVYICLSLITLYGAVSLKNLLTSRRSMGIQSKEFIESNRMLGLSFQSQGLLDLAFEKFRKCPLDSAMKDVIYNLGLDYERKRMINKAIAVYEYIVQNDNKFRELSERIAKLKTFLSALPPVGSKGTVEGKILVAEETGIKPTVGRYEILEELGQGAMGIVYKARDPKINRLLAIKTIRFSDDFEEGRVRGVKSRFLKEAEIAGKLSHPSIISIYDAGEDYDLTYLAMEFLDGKDLRDYCTPKSLLPLRRVLQITGEVARALGYAHAQGVVHRDIKPANIMLLKNGEVKVTDFGIAKAMSSIETKSGVVLGTPSYMSPEQINGQQVDGRSDIFSLGVVFFELLTGKVPFSGKNMTNLLYQITQMEHLKVREMNPKVPKACEQIIDKALAKRPEDRFQKAADLVKYLKAVVKKIDELDKSPGL